jgi:L-aspartate oxidase
VVARAVWSELSRGGRVFLDARQALGPRFAEAFPTVAGACFAAGVDPATDLIPIRPAAHYQCGGVTVDPRGRTTVPGLWAVGEVASTGLHGANRLASNSLLEAVVCGGWVADDLAATLPGQTRSSGLDGTAMLGDLPSGAGWPWEADAPGTGEADARRLEVRAVMSRAVGILRDGPGLEEAEQALLDTRRTDGEEVDDLTLVALLVTRCARLRRESRGGHARTDHPELDDRAAHTTVTLADACNGWDGALTRVGEPVAAPGDAWDKALIRLRGTPRRVNAPPLASHFAHSGESR